MFQAVLHTDYITTGVTSAFNVALQLSSVFFWFIIGIQRLKWRFVSKAKHCFWETDIVAVQKVFKNATNNLPAYNGWSLFLF